MYLLVLFVLLAVGALLAWRGFVVAGSFVAIGALAFFGTLDLWAEAIWFDALGYAARFWTFIGAEAGMALACALLALVGVALLATPARRLWSAISPWAEFAGAAGGAVWGLGNWQQVLLFIHRTSAGVAEPILGLDAGFYLFTLPFLEVLQGLLVWILVVTTASTAIAVLRWWRSVGPRADEGPIRAPVATVSITLGALVGAGALLAIPRLLYSGQGVTAGPGWTDVHVRLPVYLVLAATTVVLAASPLIAPLRRWVGRRATHLARSPAPSVLATAVTAWAFVAVTWAVLGGLVPSAFQFLAVEPNEITYERPYIANNIRLTRYAFGLDRVEQRQYPADQALTRETIANNRHLLSEVRLWDWRALDAVYQQFQEIRLYYEFVDVDMDRYQVDGQYRQVMISARELSHDSLPAQSQTFVNRRFKYTHGYGLTLATVSDFTPEGLPNLLVKDIPPKAQFASLRVERPEIYYGELTRDPVVVNTAEREFDHPSGQQNAYTRYQGGGGVEMRNLWRKILFGWRLDGTRFLLSGYPHPQSRIMLHRQIEERVQRLAPFLTLDGDPYLVLADGRLYWILDAYTTTRRFPYSEPFVPEVDRAQASGTPDAGYLEGVNYLRNSVKVVVDAYEGDVDFYAFDPDDPILRTWRRALPGLFRPREEMPAPLRAHVRYPEGLLLAQGLVYAKYHMDDPEVFYNQEDLWVRATEKHYRRIEPVEPYYVMWELPGSDRAEFVLMLPFTPKNRQVMIGWIAGLCDGDNYGRFLAYQFPKERRVLGPQQVETKIDQDSYLSGQLTLWDQRGSNVIRGNVLAIPLDDTLLYVEPIYLQAETAAYPELRLVAVMHGDKLSYAETFDAALQGLFEPGAGQVSETGGAMTPASLRQVGQSANAAFARYLEAQGAGRFADAAAALEELESLLAQFATAQQGEERSALPVD
ncbi:hypothetical protein Thimo_1573 [Thioflavicoccus mobilis 8321]|uniref:UPF0182 protein Thimo_1573 n=1 Tax=Thioflavicoccus mobilis 8321 TaxID=765912 RepID=L0GYG3_9GAMM|nr:UPF0182 family protein [Thioflavicoccus mobilis]AGA90354.1 hypothetical protein Thimo_1573 [Thioflavicoccus mobilis 8321]